MRFTLLLLSLLSMHFVAAQNAQGGFGNDISTEKLNFQLYPNPYTGGKLHIVSQPTGVKNVVILNILGEVVFQITTYEDYVMPNNLVSGIYIVNIQQGSQQGLSRLVVPWLCWQNDHRKFGKFLGNRQPSYLWGFGLKDFLFSVRKQQGLPVFLWPYQLSSFRSQHSKRHSLSPHFFFQIKTGLLLWSRSYWFF